MSETERDKKPIQQFVAEDGTVFHRTSDLSNLSFAELLNEPVDLGRIRMQLNVVEFEQPVQSEEPTIVPDEKLAELSFEELLQQPVDVALEQIRIAEAEAVRFSALEIDFGSKGEVISEEKDLAHDFKLDEQDETEVGVVSTSFVQRIAEFTVQVGDRFVVSAVTSLNDIVNPNDGQLSLREAVMAANARVGGLVDEITLSAPARSFVNAIVDSGYNPYIINSQIDVTDDLVIRSTGSAIDAQGLSRLFYVHPGASLTIIGPLELRNGAADQGGTIYVDSGELYLVGGLIFDSSASSQGGGIYAVDSNVTLVQSQIASSKAPQGGGLYAENSQVDIYDTAFVANQNHDGGAAIFNNGSDIYIMNSSFAFNNGIDVIHNMNDANTSLFNTIVQHADPNNAFGGDGVALYGPNAIISYGFSFQSNAIFPLLFNFDPYASFVDSGAPLSDIAGQFGFPTLEEMPTIQTDMSLVNPRIAGQIDIGQNESSLLDSPLSPVFVNNVVSLVQAINAANATPNEKHLILLDPGEYDLSSVGDLVISSSILIANAQFTGVPTAEAALPSVVLSGGNLDRIFTVTDKGSLVLNGNITLTQGSADNGGAIYNDGSVVLIGTKIFDNHATENGGGIYNTSKALFSTFHSSSGNIISGNSAGNEGGGIYIASHPELSLYRNYLQFLEVSDNQSKTGAGIYSDGGLLLLASSVFDNHALEGGAGVYLANRDNLSVMYYSTIGNNTSDAYGGGIFSANGAVLTVFSSTISGNQAPVGAGLFSGVGVMPDEGVFLLKSSVIAGNGEIADIVGNTYGSFGYNAIGKIDPALAPFFFAEQNDFINVSLAQIGLSEFVTRNHYNAFFIENPESILIDNGDPTNLNQNQVGYLSSFGNLPRDIGATDYWTTTPPSIIPGIEFVNPFATLFNIYPIGQSSSGVNLSATEGQELTLQIDMHPGIGFNDFTDFAVDFTLNQASPGLNLGTDVYYQQVGTYSGTLHFSAADLSEYITLSLPSNSQFDFSSRSFSLSLSGSPLNSPDLNAQLLLGNIKAAIDDPLNYVGQWEEPVYVEFNANPTINVVEGSSAASLVLLGPNYLDETASVFILPSLYNIPPFEAVELSVRFATDSFESLSAVKQTLETSIQTSDITSVDNFFVLDVYFQFPPSVLSIPGSYSIVPDGLNAVDYQVTLLSATSAFASDILVDSTPINIHYNNVVPFISLQAATNETNETQSLVIDNITNISQDLGSILVTAQIQSATESFLDRLKLILPNEYQTGAVSLIAPDTYAMNVSYSINQGFFDDNAILIPADFNLVSGGLDYVDYNVRLLSAINSNVDNIVVDTTPVNLRIDDLQLNTALYNGTWKLSITDNFFGDQGVLHSWSILFHQGDGSIVRYDSVTLDSPILDLNTLVSTIDVTNFPLVDITNLSVEFDWEHTWASDLTVMLTSPNAAEAVIVNNFAFDGDLISNGGLNRYEFNDITGINNGYFGDIVPFGTYKSDNNGLSELYVAAATDAPTIDTALLNGVWQLQVSDTFSGDEGLLHDWAIVFHQSNGNAVRYGSIILDQPILDNTGFQTEITVDNVPTDTTFMSLEFNWEHTWTSDIEVKLMSPNLAQAVVVSSFGGGGDSISDGINVYEFNDETGVSGGFFGDTIPFGAYTSFNDGLTNLFAAAVQSNPLAPLLTPVFLDLDGGGVQFTPLSESHTRLDVNGDGVTGLVSWIKSNDGILAWDQNHNQLIDGVNEFAFGKLYDNHYSDLESFKRYFDSNQDGIFNSQDDKFNEVGVWQDSNHNAISEAGEFKSLGALNIADIFLDATKSIDGLQDGNVIYGTTSYADTAGNEHLVVDVGLAYADMSLQSQLSAFTVTKETPEAT